MQTPKPWRRAKPSTITPAADRLCRRGEAFRRRRLREYVRFVDLEDQCRRRDSRRLELAGDESSAGIMRKCSNPGRKSPGGSSAFSSSRRRASAEPIFPGGAVSCPAPGARCRARPAPSGRAGGCSRPGRGPSDRGAETARSPGSFAPTPFVVFALAFCLTAGRAETVGRPAPARSVRKGSTARRAASRRRHRRCCRGRPCARRTAAGAGPLPSALRSAVR